MTKKFLTWDEVTDHWEDIDLTWDEFFVLVEVNKVVRGGGNSSIQDYINGNPWKVNSKAVSEKYIKKDLSDKLIQDIGEENTNKFIKVLCRVNGLEYDALMESSSDIRVSVMMVEKVLNRIKVDIKK